MEDMNALYFSDNLAKIVAPEHESFMT